MTGEPLSMRLLMGLMDALLLPFVVCGGLLLKGVRKAGLQRLRGCAKALKTIGVLPVRRHYYEPYVSEQDLRMPLHNKRSLPGIEWNLDGQLRFLASLRYENEFAQVLSEDFRFGNGAFESGDAEFLYQVIRLTKPRRVFEIGSGNSTIVARAAIRKNQNEDAGYRCKHICIEPFESAWLESAGITVLRKRVEEVDISFFDELDENDLLFIDSSHVIRPQGDVVTEYLQILPVLRKGVIVHVHDIFSPRDYLSDWIIERGWLWNEQYLLEAFLTQNPSWKILAGLNMLRHEHFEALRRVCPYLTSDREPGSFYIQRVS